MTNEERQLLLKDLSARLPYNVDTYSPSELRNVRHFDYHELIPIGLEAPKDMYNLKK